MRNSTLIKLTNRPVGPVPVAIALAVAVMLPAAFAAPASAVTPAALDQYSENPPRNLGDPKPGRDREGDGGGAASGTGPGTPSGGALIVPGPTRAPASAVRSAVDSSDPGPAQRGGATLPVLGYPLTPFLVILLIVLFLALLAMIARRIASRLGLTESPGGG